MTTVPLAAYLGRRLAQLGVDDLFGVPGDFNLDLLDGLAALGAQRWVGSTNELNAGYAADAYARRRGLAAVVTTYGVGELSAMNAIAGSNAEDVPVVHVVGAPRTRAVAAGARLHHTLADGVFDHFSKAFEQVSVAVETLTAERATQQVDDVLLAALTHRKPAYLAIPQDLAMLAVDAAPLERPLSVPAHEAATADLTTALTHRLIVAAQPVIVLGHLADRFGVADEVMRAAQAGGIPVVTQLGAKGSVDESHPLHAGDHAGTMVDGGTTDLVASADLVLEVGTVWTDVLSGFFTHRPADGGTVVVGATRTRAGGRTYELGLPEAVAALGAACATVRHEDTRLPDRPPAAAPTLDDEPLTQQGLWDVVQAWLPAGTALLTDTGTANWGAFSLRLPDDTVMVGQPIWNSIGYALPATLGQGLAEPGRRPVLVIGDGAAQMTVQELGTVAAAGIRPVVLLLDNSGYTIERALQSPDATYNDVVAWDWPSLLKALCGTVSHHHAATTRELADALKLAADDTDHVVVVQAALDRYDAPPLLRELARRNAGGTR